MRLDHVSYVASHDQISDVVNRIGSQIGTAFVDGGIHPKFGTRNFTAPLLNGQYIEVVCPLDHPATDTTPFGMAVKKKADEGGGWFTWVIAVTNLNSLEEVMNRKAVSGERKKPNGENLFWKQIGINNLHKNPNYPFYIQWISKNHPSLDGIPKAKISELTFCGLEFNEISNSKVKISDLSLDCNLKFEKSNDNIGPKSVTFVVEERSIVIN